MPAPTASNVTPPTRATTAAAGDESAGRHMCLGQARMTATTSRTKPSASTLLMLLPGNAGERGRAGDTDVNRGRGLRAPGSSPGPPEDTCRTPLTMLMMIAPRVAHQKLAIVNCATIQCVR